jgi:thiol-disulfide isomerase/thioredoxin
VRVVPKNCIVVRYLFSHQHQQQQPSYISTMTASQRIVRDSGILFGPKQAQQHLEMMKPTPIVPPPRFGETVERLLSLGITYNVQYKGPTAVRTWNLPDFWELASWPRDSSGGSNVRFGLPVLDDLGLDLLQEELDRQEERDSAVSTPASEAANPYVTSIIGMEGLHQTIVAPQQDCLLFLSAPFCRTCRTLGPLYTRMARLQEESDIIFAKADTSGKLGKALSRALEVEAVPTFVLFRNGKRYGTALGVTRIPSKKLDLALQLLSSGEEWDSTAFRELEEQEEKTNKK